MMNFGNRLRSIRELTSLSQGDMASALAIKQGTLADYERNKAYPSVAVLLKIESIYHINLHWLITGDGTMYIPPENEFIPEIMAASAVRIPIVGSIAAGTPLEILNVEPEEYIVLDKTKIHNPKQFLCMRVEGDSMFPEIRNGDLVLINTHFIDSTLHHSICAVRINGEVTLKSVYIDHKHKQTLLVPYNSKYEPIMLDFETNGDIVILGVMVLLIRKYV